MPFEKGQSGNPGGRAKDRPFKDALRLAINRADGDKTKLARIAEALVDKAVEGDVAAATFVADRVEGKPTQVIAGDEENPLFPVAALRDLLAAKLDRVADAKPAPKPEG
jgi:hypothetical protein